MDHKADTVSFIIIIFVALVVIGLVIFTFTGKANVTGKAVISQGTCYQLNSGILQKADVSFCCQAIKSSTRCILYTKDLTRCSGTVDAVMDKETIQACER